jgi:ABC-type branched-subunit amino acid transport system permease subunit
MSVLGPVVGTIGYTVLSRFLSPASTKRWFTILAVVVIVAMFYSPFGITNAPISEIVILEIMHFVVAGALVYFLPRAAQS